MTTWLIGIAVFVIIALFLWWKIVQWRNMPAVEAENSKQAAEVSKRVAARQEGRTNRLGIRRGVRRSPAKSANIEGEPDEQSTVTHE